jgi:4'-phosphopantetheinyl transferase
MGNSLSWFPSVTPQPLSDNELHVWRASLDLAAEVRERLQGSLNSEEKSRAERFLVAEAREQFVAARGILRELLGAYVGVDPQSVALSYRPKGKPWLSPDYNSTVCFNVSHSHGMGLFVFARNREVGVDIEYVKENFRGMEIASHFFSEREIAALAQLPRERMGEAFFGYWTRKEAYVKAHGQGLSIPLDSFTVEFSRSEQVLSDETGARWSCYALEVAPGFAASVVAEGEGWKMKLWDWSAGLKRVAAVPLVD